ncbi:MAG: tetratricopeptide repeat protein [SAR324 cluster bacterium]
MQVPETASPAAQLREAFALHQAGRLAEAGALYERVLAMEPPGDAPHGKALQGEALHEKAPHEKSLHERSLHEKTLYGEALHHLGLVRYQQGMAQEGLRLIQAALEQGLREPRVYQNLATVLEHLGRMPEALQARRDAAHCAAASSAAATRAAREPGASAPLTAQAYAALADEAERRGDFPEATRNRRQALALAPDNGAGWLALARVLAARERPQEALAALEQALRVLPGSAVAYSARAALLEDLLRLPEAVASLRQALALEPRQPAVHSRLLWLLNYEDPPHALAMREEAERWARVQAADIVPCTGHSNVRDPLRPLHLGIVCADFRAHPAASFLGQWFEHHDARDIALTCYSDVAKPDVFTERFRQRADRWREVVGVPDEQLAGMIRDDGIDILLDRTGHMVDHRLLVFARKPAPVQVAYMGYANTRGLAAIDWWLTDRLVNPPDSQAQFTERLAYLPGCFLSYAPPLLYPPVAPPPSCRSQGCGTQGGRAEPFTFGSFNNAAKLSPRTIRLWSRVLEAVPGARLLLRSATLERRAVQQRLASQFAGHGIAPERLQFDGFAQKQTYLAEYGRVDVALDSVPNNGVTTTLDALWMGVPVLTLTGDTAVSRYCTSILNHGGWPEWVAATEDGFVELAVRLADDPSKLAALRLAQRQRMAASPLCDGPGFTRGLEAALRGLWVDWCKG